MKMVKDDADYQKYRFSVTCQTGDVAVLHCLRALCQWAEEWRKPQIGWGGTSEDAWKASGGKLTLRFTEDAYRTKFMDKALELLGDRYQVLTSSDNDPASRQRVQH